MNDCEFRFSQAALSDHLTIYWVWTLGPSLFQAVAYLLITTKRGHWHGKDPCDQLRYTCRKCWAGSGPGIAGARRPMTLSGACLLKGLLPPSLFCCTLFILGVLSPVHSSKLTSSPMCPKKFSWTLQLIDSLLNLIEPPNWRERIHTAIISYLSGVPTRHDMWHISSQ